MADRVAQVPHGSRWSALVRLVTDVVRVDPFRAGATIAVLAGGHLSALAMAYALKLIVDGAVPGSTGDRDAVWAGAALMAGGLVLQLGATYPTNTLGMTLREKVALAMESRVIKLTAAIPGLEHHERPEYLDRMQLLRDGGNFVLGEAAASLVDAIGMLALIGGSSAMLATVHPALALLPVAALPAILAESVKARLRERTDDELAPMWRAKKGLRELAWDPAWGPELRLGGAARTVLARQREAAEEIERRRLRLAFRLGLLQSAGDAVLGIAQVAAVAFVGSRVVRGEQPSGDLVLTIVLAGRLDHHIVMAIEGLKYLLGLLRVVSHLQWLDAHARGTAPPSGTLAVPTRLADGITLRGVGFSYPGTDALVLDGLDLDLPAGATVALVGENGAGKTTLVKLLCRFYGPSIGSITIDGSDLSAFDVEEWRTRVTAVFQDFARLELPLVEAIGVGDLAAVADADTDTDEDRVAVAAEAAGLARWRRDLPDGLATRLGRRFAGGHEPSGGQWQMVALARGLMRTSPLLFVLDEPTAALDPQAEHDLFETARRAAADNPARGVTLFVSHRFSTVRLADRIAVVEAGRVIEAGTHDDLAARPGGRYAALFERQARAYR